MTVAILGAGWLGAPLGRRLASDGHSVYAATTTPAKREALRADGLVPFLLTVTPEGVEGERASDFFQAEALVVTVPPGRGTDDAEVRYTRIIEQVAEAAAAGSVRHLVYTSSTSVYPDSEGARSVTEASAGPAGRLSASGRACLTAEDLLKEGLFATAILRLGGLYGPGRSPARYLAGTTDRDGGDRPVNLVHRDDVIAGIQRVLRDGLPGTYNLVANEHPMRRDFYPAAARALGLDPPTFAPSTGPVRGKLVSNARALTLLGLSFRPLDSARHREDTEE